MILVVHSTATLKDGLRMRSRNSTSYTNSNHRINGNFGALKNDIGDQCTILGIASRNFDIGFSTRSQRIKAWTGTVIQAHGLAYLDQSEALGLQTICGSHGSDQSSLIKIPHCLCCRVGGIIHGFGATILALMQCVYDPRELRVQADIINGNKLTPWTRTAIATEGLIVDGFATSTHLFIHLSQLVHGPEALRESDILDLAGIDILAVSIDSVTVYYRALLNAEAFDDRGRTLSITSGRISHKGVLRRLVKEVTVLPLDNGSVDSHPKGNCAKMTDKFVVIPHYAKGPVELAMEVTLGEDAFWIKSSLRSDDRKRSGPIGLSLCINNLLLTPVSGPCSHKKDRGWPVRQEHSIYIVTLSGQQRNLSGAERRQCILAYALKDSTLEQLFQIGVLGPENTVIQGESCLECAVQTSGIDAPNVPHVDGNIIMT
jgi:hypothetical protein